MTTDKEQEAKSYIRKLRNANKKAYAVKYFKWCLGGQKGREPESSGLSVMGAQAVRLAIADILK